MFAYSILSALILVLAILGMSIGSEEDTNTKEKENEEVCSNYLCTNKQLSQKKDQSLHPPLKQFKNGIPPIQIQCKDEYNLVLKSTNKKPYCVKESSVMELVQRGWATSPEEQQQLLFRSLAPSFVAEPTMPDKKPGTPTTLAVLDRMIGENEFWIISGTGWHGLHSVEVTILTDESVIDSVRSKTSKQGILYIPWLVPDELPRKNYTVKATDGIHMNQINVMLNNYAESNTPSSSLGVIVDGQKQVRRGTTHTISVEVLRDSTHVNNARIFLTIEDYGENVIREFKGRTNSEGLFVFTWEIPDRFDDIETLLAFIDVTDGISSTTKLFRFQVYCLPNEEGCKAEGN